MNKKFVASYSGGKDSILAIHRTIGQGNQLLALIITYNTDKNRSWFHGIPKPILERVSDSLGVPVWLVETTGEAYAKNFEKILHHAKLQGADACVFGDIDIEGHHEWCSARCQEAGIEALFPLWNENRKTLVYEFIDQGFVANMTVIDTNRLSEYFLGSVLTKSIVDEIEAQGVDACGENGEYHTFVSGGPLFNEPIDFSFGEKVKEEHYVILPLNVRE
jgi:uncharacterized protein (TIGR00290 family)